MKKLTHNLHLLFYAFLLFIFLSFPNYSFTQAILYGDSAVLGNGMVRTWVQTNAQGNRELIGISLTDEALNNLDAVRQLFVLRFPLTPGDSLFNHMFFGWNPQGHPPPNGVYLPPHFDFHFTTTSIAEREAVIPGPDSIPFFLYTPQDHFYDFPAGAVPRQGTHWADSTDPVWQGSPLTHSHTYGFYRGKIFFYEPHISRSYLLTNPNVNALLKQPTLYTRTGRFPLTYRISHDAINHTYNIVLGDFIFREADPPMPVELSSFVAIVNGRNVKLNWTTASEENNSGFEIERSIVNGEWSMVNFITGHGNSNVTQNYYYDDRNLNSGNYKYRLKQIDYNGNYKYYDLQYEVVIGNPEKYSLSQNYPNPFNPATNLEFGVSKRGFVSLKVYDLVGKEVATIVNSDLNPGIYKYNFNASVLGSGLYIYKLTIDGNIIDSKRMILLK